MRPVLPSSSQHWLRRQAFRPARQLAPPAPGPRAKCVRPRPRCTYRASHRQPPEPEHCASRTLKAWQFPADSQSLGTSRCCDRDCVVDAGGKLHPLTQNVSQKNVALLDARGIAGAYAQAHVGETRHPATALPGHGHGEGAEVARSLQGGANVAALSRGRNADHDVSRSAQRLQLAVEHFAEATVVGDGGQNGSIGGESDGWQRPAIVPETSHKFGGQMLCVRGAAAVAAPQNLVALQQTVGHANGGALQGILLRVKLTDNGEMFGDGVGEDAGQVQRRRHTLLVHNELRIFSEPCWSRLLFEIIVAMSSERANNFSNIAYVFLDRDGVLNRNPPGGGFVTSWEQFEWLPGVEEAIARLNRSARKVILVTNQRGIALGLYSEADLHLMHHQQQRDNWRFPLRYRGWLPPGNAECLHCRSGRAAKTWRRSRCCHGDRFRRVSAGFCPTISILKFQVYFG